MTVPVLKICIGILMLVECVLMQKNTNMWSNRSTIVHLFEWKFYDIADECERFLQYKGYGGVQVSPVSENIIVHNRPWWERYQPISYKIASRSGNEEEFLNMTTRCNAVGVRIYVDVVFNHMAAKQGNVSGVGGSTADTDEKSYPNVSFISNDFHESCEIKTYQDANIVRNCELLGLSDLNQESEHVRGKIVDFLNKLVELGVAGFRVDAAKHMWPSDLNIIYNRVKNLNTNFGFPSGTRPYIFQEVAESKDEPISAEEYFNIGAVTEFNYCSKIGTVFGGSDKLHWLRTWGQGWGFFKNSEDALVFVDNHDKQRDGGNILTYKQAKQFKMAIAFMLAHPYGNPRIMSSFDFTDKNAGPPSDIFGNIISPDINPDDTCTNGWICEHRWRQIYNMIGFRNAVKDTEINEWWSDGNQRIAFCRGGKGFIAFTNGGSFSQNMKTCLPPGTYCDVISGNLIDGSCSGKSVNVNNNGTGFISLCDNEFDGMLAIHINAKIP